MKNNDIFIPIIIASVTAFFAVDVFVPTIKKPAQNSTDSEKIDPSNVDIIEEYGTNVNTPSTILNNLDTVDVAEIIDYVKDLNTLHKDKIYEEFPQIKDILAEILHRIYKNDMLSKPAIESADADSLLQSRINEIISNSNNVPTLAEIVDILKNQ